MCIEVFMEKIIQGSGRRESEERGKMVSSNAYENFPSRCERLLLNHERHRDSWPPEEKNSIRGQRQGLIAQSFCVIEFFKV